MDITQFFQQEPTESKKERAEIRKKKRIAKTFNNYIRTFTQQDIIDLLEYTHLLHFYESGGTIVDMYRYHQIVSNIMNCSKLKDHIKNSFMNIIKDRQNKKIW